MKTERMTILVTPEQKAAIVARAERLGVSAGEMLRRAADSFGRDRRGRSSEEEALLDTLADELSTAAAEAREALAAANRELRTTLAALARRREAVRGGH